MSTSTENNTPEILGQTGSTSDLEEGRSALDLTESLIPLPTQQYNHTQAQERARRNIAYALIALVFIVLIVALAYFYSLPLSTNTKLYTENLVFILQIIFTPLITLTGTAVGYYFGSNSK